jgi:surfeit locus 1 family protein
MFNFQFRPGLWSTVAAVVGVAATVGLGNWQLGRAQEKLGLAAAQERLAREPALHLGEMMVPAVQAENRQVEVRGRFDARGTILLDNRVRNGIVGYEVVTPIRIADAHMHVLVNRGWVAGTGDRRRLPDIRTPGGEVAIIGRAVVPGKRLYELSADTTEGRVWQNLTIERYRTQMKYTIQNVVIEQNNDTDDGLMRVWPAVDRGVNTHRSYAFQWFALAVLITVIYAYFSFRRVASND